MKFLKKLVAAAIACASINAAHATVITGNWDPVNDIAVTTDSSYDYFLNISTQLNSLIADGGTYQIDSAKVDIYLKDPNKGNETVSFTLGNGTGMVDVISYTGNNHVSNGNSLVDFGIDLANALADLRADGILPVLLKALTGEYVFDKSTLTAQVTYFAPVISTPPASVDPADVPEPGSIALLGLGLFCAAMLRRRAA